MPRSTAQTAANLTIGLPDDDAEVARRSVALHDELKPTGEMGRYLVRRVATLSVRVERSARHESATIAEKVRNAEAAFDDERLADVEHLMGWIGSEPATFARRLRQLTAGIDAMIRSYEDVKRDMFHAIRKQWDFGHYQRLENLAGRRTEDYPISRLWSLHKATWGDYSYLDPGEVDHLADDDGRRWWAREQIGEIIDVEVGRLRALRETIDPEALAADRAGAADRALFDPSKEAILARKYEAAAERGMYRALRELEQVEARSARAAETSDPVGPPLGSFEPEEGVAPALAPTTPDRPSAPSPRAPWLGRIGGPGERPESPGSVGVGFV